MKWKTKIDRNKGPNETADETIRHVNGVDLRLTSGESMM